MRRITFIEHNMKWADFRKKFWKFFPISDEIKRIKLLKEEYTRLTGRDPEEEPEKKRRKKHGEAPTIFAETSESDRGESGAGSIGDHQAK